MLQNKQRGKMKSKGNSTPSKLATLMVFFVFFLNFFPTYGNAAEIDHGVVVVDRKPWKISWIEEDNHWILLANFDKGTLKTYFNNAPPEKSFGLSRHKKPTRQELEFYFGLKFTSTDCQYEQWPDGAKAYSFKYEQKLQRGNEKFNAVTTAIIEECDRAENEIRYSLFR